MNSTPVSEAAHEAAVEREAIQAEGMVAIEYSWGRDSLDAYPKQRTAETFAAFAKFVCGHRAKRKGQFYFCAPFVEQDGKHHRCKDDAAPRRFLPLDLDYIPDAATLSDLLLALQPYRHFAYTTASHTPELPRLRVVLELSRPVSRDDGIRLGLAFQASLAGQEGVKFDETVYRAEQPCFGPLTGAEVYPRDRRMSGAAVDVDELLANAPELAPEISTSERAERIAHDDPRIAHLYQRGFVLDVKSKVGTLPIRCPHAAAHSHETGPTATVVLLPYFNGVTRPVIKCLHASCADVSQDEFWRLAGYVDPSKRANGAGMHEEAPHENSASASDSSRRADAKAKAIVVGGALTLARSIPDPTYVARPILVRGKLGTLTAHPSHGKTTFMVGLCVALATGHAFGPISADSDGLIYIVSAEDVVGTRNRILAEAARLRLDADARERLDQRLRWAHADAYATTTELFVAMESDADGRDVDLVFVDTGPALFGGDDENDNVALRNFVDGFRVFRELPGNPVTVLAWHPPKGATADRLEPRGASAINASTDFNLTLWREDNRVTLHHTKLRALHFDPIEGAIEVLTIDPGPGDAASTTFYAPVVVLNTGDKPERSDTRQAREAILACMYVARRNPPTVRDLANATQVPNATVGRHLQKMATAKPPLVALDPVADHYTLTKAGETRAKTITEQSAKDYQNGRNPG